MKQNIKVGSVVDYCSIICIVKVISDNGRLVIKSERGNLYKVGSEEVEITTKIFKQ